MSKKTGRPREEGGHQRIDITVNKFVAEALEKVENKSRFLESVAQPVLEQLDPGDASPAFWQIDAYLKEQIIDAVDNGEYGRVYALSWLAAQLAPVQNLCGTPPSTFHATPLHHAKARDVFSSIREYLADLTEDPWDRMARKRLI